MPPGNRGGNGEAWMCGGEILQPLEALTNLTQLTLGGIAGKAAAHDPEAVRGVLSKLPRLCSLSLSDLNARFAVPPSVERVCFDLRLDVETGNSASSVGIYHAVADALKDLKLHKCVTLGSFMFDYQGSASDQMPQIRYLCNMPFEIKCASAFCLISHEFWSIKEFIDICEALQPLQPSFASVKALNTMHVCIEPSALRALASLFQGCESLCLEYEAQPMNLDVGLEDDSQLYQSYERGGLQELVCGMPKLSYLQCRMFEMPRAVYMRALRAACEAGRPFKLVLLVGLRLQEAQMLQQEWQEWQGMQTMLLRQSQKVQLEIQGAQC